MTRHLQVIIGLGATGLSCARYLQSKGIPFAVTDSRPNPPNLAEFKKLFPKAIVSVGKIDEELLNQATQLIISPGISTQESAVVKQANQNIPVIGDIELFAQTVNAPVIAITGTNAKSTVTTLVGEMARSASKNVQVGGNLGVPALDLLTEPQADVFVMELSSFQLDTTRSLRPAVATVLNVTPDHMDRYATLQDYCSSKQQVYSNCKVAVSNRDDVMTTCHQPNVETILRFTLDEPNRNEFGIKVKKDEPYLAFEDQLLMPVKELPVLGRHYQANALAALAIGYGFGLPLDPMLHVLQTFQGLPHRCQLVRELQGVYWYNDSKGTNVGATLAAIQGLGSEIKGKLILIAGGVGKNADFAPLIPPIEKYVKTVVLIGEAAPIMAQLIGDRVEIRFGKTMDEAVVLAKESATVGDSVLLSPACASFDMFSNFEHRGRVFSDIVLKL